MIIEHKFRMLDILDAVNW